ncbi:MAG: hypothetical protein WA951_02160 [Leeuwenhoekiella sp.]
MTSLPNYLRQGIPTFVDKPLTYSLDETKELLELAELNDTLLYVGFNRRFAPLVSNLLEEETDPIQINWQKNRTNLPADPRTFIFDDFIHVLDSLQNLAVGAIENLNVTSLMNNGLLENIYASWHQGKTLLNGSMNRISGIIEERIEYYTPGNKWLLENLETGFHYQNGKTEPIGFNHWQSTLYKRGFVTMIDDFFRLAIIGKYNKTIGQKIFETHNLCENILQKI